MISILPPHNIYSTTHLLLFLLFQCTIALHQPGPPPPAHMNGGAVPPELNCLLRCVTKCSTPKNNYSSTSITHCEEACRPYGEGNLCGRGDAHCWRRCKDMGEQERDKHPPPTNFTATYNTKGRIDLRWEYEGAEEPHPLFFIQIHSINDHSAPSHHVLTQQHSLIDFLPPGAMICGDTQYMVARLSARTGVGPFSQPAGVDEARPQLGAKMRIHSITFNGTQYVTDTYTANGTLTLTLEYDEVKNWALGDADLEVRPLFHLLSCADPDLTQAIPVAEFYKGPLPHTMEAKLGADMMYRRCKFVYGAVEARSHLCQRSYPLSPNDSDYSSLEIDCEKVNNSHCPQPSEALRPPLCGQIESFGYEVLRAEEVDWSDPAANLSINITFRPFTRRQSPKAGAAKERGALYHVALWGDAIPYNDTEELFQRSLLGVQMVSVLGNASSFPSSSFTTTSIQIDGLHPDTLYGVMICGVMDPRNLTFPPISHSTKKYMRTRADPVQVPSSLHRRSNNGYVLLGVLALVAITTIILVLLWRRRSRHLAKRKVQLMAEGMRRVEVEQRYTDLPRRVDSWELERRNLLIYEDKRLGAGAFGAVYLGRLLNVNTAATPLQPSLSANLARAEAEHCEVAVKMLPEYADPLSKEEFLREIEMMKGLGYHERLCNMVACITATEPYALVVEYCSDGDLLHFLKQRCEYMCKLNASGITDYASSGQEDIDLDMVMTIRQLLMFAVQISYALEYLSGKGFVHRDVAARNVLVHSKNHAAKLGDFGLCRYIYANSNNYKSRGGRLPVKWMSPEAIRHYEFSTSSDVWSFGVLLFEIITLGGTPYPGIQPDDMLELLEGGGRIPQPDNCPEDFYAVMLSCWREDPAQRPSFSTLRQQLALQLEKISDDYLILDPKKEYYHVTRREEREQAGVVDG